MECGGVSVEICNGCGGAWLQEGRLSALNFQDDSAREELLWEARRIRSGRLKKIQYELFCPKDALILLAKPIGMLTRTPILTCPQCQANFIDFQFLSRSAINFTRRRLSLSSRPDGDSIELFQPAR